MSMTLHAVWEKAQPALKEKIGPSSYDTWFPWIHIKEKNPHTLIIETPDEYFKNWFVEHYLACIRETLAA